MPHGQVPASTGLLCIARVMALYHVPYTQQTQSGLVGDNRAYPAQLGYWEMKI